MRCNLAHPWYSRLSLAAAGAFSLLIAFAPGMLGATPPGSGIIRIEEDWQIVLTEPGDDLNVPQFHTVMSPYGSQNSTYFQVSWNYREAPDFEPGGLQLQVWNGEDFYTNRNIDDGALSHAAETVTWTQSLNLDHRDLTFAVTSGCSSSWGNFGGESMTVRLPAGVHSLAGYNTNVSAGASWVTYGANRVVRLQIVETRTYDEDGLRDRITTPRIVYEYQDGGD